MKIINFSVDFFLFLFPIFFIFLFNKNISIKSLFIKQGFTRIKLKKLVFCSVICLVMLLSLSYLLNILAMMFNVSDLHLVSNVFKTLPWYTILYLFVFRTFLEEWFFRSFLVSRIGVFISSFIFAIAHIGYGSIIELIGAFVLGFLLSKIYSINKNIFCTYIPHLIYNFLILLLIM